MKITKIITLLITALCISGCDQYYEEPSPPEPIVIDQETGYPIHTVKTGEDVYAVAIRWGTSPKELTRENKLTSIELEPGTELLIPQAEDDTSRPRLYKSSDQNKQQVVYRVQEGEDLYAVAIKLGISPVKNREINDLHSVELTPGTELIISQKLFRQTKPMAVSGPLGSKTNPIRCDLPDGEHEYLNKLHSPDGSNALFHRIGHVGMGPYGNILDAYKVNNRKESFMVYMDMYHQGFTETNAVPGFKTGY